MSGSNLISTQEVGERRIPPVAAKRLTLMEKAAIIRANKQAAKERARPKKSTTPIDIEAVRAMLEE